MKNQSQLCELRFREARGFSPNQPLTKSYSFSDRKLSHPIVEVFALTAPLGHYKCQLANRGVNLEQIALMMSSIKSEISSSSFHNENSREVTSAMYYAIKYFSLDHFAIDDKEVFIL